MKTKLYTLAHDVSLLKQIDRDGGQFTAEEHAYAIEKEFGKTVFKTRDDLLRYYLPLYLPRLGSLGFLIDAIKGSGYKNILSLGAGPCVLEYLLKMALPEESLVVACDFDWFVVNRAKKFFPEIIAERFDFFKDEIVFLKSKLNIEFDCAVFFASAYVMDDAEFIKLFGDLKKVGVKRIIDFHAGYMDSRAVIMHCLRPFTMNATLRKLFRKSPISSGGYRGKFHGYSRNRSELRKLYKKSGLELQEEILIPASGDKYIAILG